MLEMPLTHVTDLGQKLEYLLHVRGGDMPGWSHRVTSQKLLALALTELGTNTDEPTIARWKRPPGDIPNLVKVAPKIAEIFDCDEQSFRRDDIITFVEKTEGRSVSWGHLVATATIVGTIREKPAPSQGVMPALRPMNARPKEAQDAEAPLPVLRPGFPLEAALPCPDVAPGVPSGPRHVLLFSGDNDGYLNWLPRYRTSKAFKNLETIPAGTPEIRVPSFGGEITVDPDADGKHVIVLVVSVDELPAALRIALEAPVQNADLMEALTALARWLAPRLRDGRAAIRRRPYFVGKPA
jgi:hypothetical protein